MSVACSSVKMSEKNGDLSFLNQEAHQWRDAPKEKIEYASSKDTTILLGGMTIIQDQLVAVALQSLGEKFVSLPNPDFQSFKTGKAFGNRGQCNPTYFTVGNLVKYLQNLQQSSGLSAKEIVQKYAYVTAGGCGPCRFGMYITEYKKALRDAGFDGFRITSFEHDKGIFQGDEEQESLLNLSPKFFIYLVRAVIIGDIINILGYQVRPYEIEKGATDKAIEKSKEYVSEAFTNHTSLKKALKLASKEFAKIKLDRTQPKPKVMVMGEFWAAMTEGDGNYNLYRFLESEGAECIPQPIINRLMLSIWESERALGKNEILADDSKKGIDFSYPKKRLLIKIAKQAVKMHFKAYAKAIGLNNYKIPDIDKLASLSEEFYTLDCEGGEGHLEVAHLIESVKDNLSHLTLSVKPFGCMPSSAVSDGVQSLVTSRFPSANFLSIETSGEGAANFYSRVQMALFKAKQSAKEEYESLSIPKTIPSKVHDYTYNPKSSYISTAAKVISSV